MSPWLSRTLVVAAALGVTGCASLSNVQTADTLGKGNIQVGIEPGLWGGAGSGGATVVPHVDASVRYGVADRLDIGVRGGSSFLELQSKVLLTTPGDPNIAVSLAPTVGGLVAFGATSGGGGSAGLLNIGVPVLIGFKTRGGSEFVIGPRMQNIIFFGAASGGSGSVYLMAVGGSLGFFWRIADNFGILPEVAAVYPVVGAAAASGAGSTGLQGLNANGVLLQFKLGAIIGGGRKPGQRPNEDLRQAPPPPPPMPPPGGDAPPPPPPPPPV